LVFRYDSETKRQNLQVENSRVSKTENSASVELESKNHDDMLCYIQILQGTYVTSLLQSSQGIIVPPLLRTYET